MKVYQQLASTIGARLNCEVSGNTEWFNKHEYKITELQRKYLPSGSGFDLGTQVDLDTSHGEKLVLNTSFHHMNEAGYYDGWTSHSVVVRPSFCGGFRIDVKGRDRNDIKDYISQIFHQALDMEVEDGTGSRT